jgi:toxin ParE1/3/4
MMTVYKLKFTPIANEDLDQIYHYISNNLAANEAAKNLMNNIEEKCCKKTRKSTCLF